ncbi:MAG: PTS sugar transporter subunit IIB [Angelakisella sp.]
MGNVYVRVDDRLIHGQIVTAWAVTLAIKEIIAIDDGLAANKMMQSIMTMGVPAAYHPQIVSVQEAKVLLSQPAAGNRLVITRFCRNLASVREEIKGCVHLNIGNCAKQADAKYTTKGIGVGQILSFTQEDFDTIEALESDGIEVMCQPLPTEKKRTWSDLKSSFH